MRAQKRKWSIKHEKFVPALRILTAMCTMAVFYGRFRVDVYIVFVIYMIYAAAKLFLGGILKNVFLKTKSLDVFWDMSFISGLIILTGGSASPLWPLYLAPVISFTFTGGGRSGILVAAAGTVLYLMAICYSELSLKNLPSDFLLAIILVTSLTYLLFYRDKKAVLKMAATDSLTRTYNLGYFQECLDRAVENYEITKEPVSLLFIDIDDFKAVNDTYGHLRGDEVLRAIGEAILLAVRKQDLVFRYGGDEFAVILQNAAREDAIHVAERIFSNVKRSVEGLTTFMKVTVSVGIAVLDQEFTDKKMFLEAADKSLYEAKRLGKNRFAIYSKKVIDSNK